MMRRIVGLWLAACFVITLAGCETVKGVGRDITGASDAVQKSFANRQSSKRLSTD